MATNLRQSGIQKLDPDGKQRIRRRSKKPNLISFRQMTYPSVRQRTIFASAIGKRHGGGWLLAVNICVLSYSRPVVSGTVTNSYP
jgi:hypothetical protein